MAPNVDRPSHPDELSAEQRRRTEAVRQLLAAWLADESGYDERAWPALKRGLEQSRTSSRPLFREFGPGPTEADIDDVRRDMWANLPREDIA